MDVGYVQISSVDPNTARQINGVQLGKVYTDKCSGKDTIRPQLLVMLDAVRKGDTVHIQSIGRLARSLSDLLIGSVPEREGRGCLPPQRTPVVVVQ